MAETMTGMDDVLGDRALNRATLHRQHLLHRSRLTPLQMIELLVGLQGQDPELPYFGLWNRIAGFEIERLQALLRDRQVARATLFRCTQHLLATSDYVWIRPLLGPMLDRMRRSFFGRRTAGVDPAELVAATRAALADGILTRSELGRILHGRWPEHEPIWLARAAQVAVAVVHPHPDGTWGRRGATPFARAEPWLAGAPLTRSTQPAAGQPDADRSGAGWMGELPVRGFESGRPMGDLVLRYLAGFGPASVQDMQAWSGLTRMREVFEELRPRLRTYRSEHGAELFDLPDIVLPDPDTPAPVRFLAGFDNVTFGYGDRRRIIADEHRPHLVVDAGLTVDGMVRGIWKQKGGSLTVHPFAPLTPAQLDAVHTEGQALLTFAAPDADHTITIN